MTHGSLARVSGNAAETVAELVAAAVTAAGWYAEAGADLHGVAVDVLATSPDGNRCNAWMLRSDQSPPEPLPSTTSISNPGAGPSAPRQSGCVDVEDALHTLQEARVGACWIVPTGALEDAAGLPPVPAISVSPGTGADDADRPVPWVVRSGVYGFTPRWCDARGFCALRVAPFTGATGGPCPGHGGWLPWHHVPLERFVGAALLGVTRAVRPRTGAAGPEGPQPSDDGAATPDGVLDSHRQLPQLDRSSDPDVPPLDTPLDPALVPPSTPPPEPWLWTTRHHWAAEQTQVEAESRRLAWEEQVVANARRAATHLVNHERPPGARQ